ncbi:MAG: hypothetical protein K6G88_11120 [Lachnospiraceae bacterium]|nr:hypothetical protein [Lachnospiraceae bacterium]
MFIRFMNEKMAVNADNFDYIRIREDSEWSDEYKVELVRVTAEISSSGGSIDIGSISSEDEAVLTIKSFKEKKEATSFYDRLQYAWINKLDIFEVE